MIKLYRVLVIVLVMLFSLSSTANSGAADDAVDATLAWLAIVDAGEYQQSWQHAAPFFQQQISSDDWQRALDQARTPLAAVLDRDVVSRERHTALPNAPAGDYVVVTLQTRFVQKPNAIETITVMNVDEVWRAVGYFIK